MGYRNFPRWTTDRPKRQNFKRYPVEYFRIDIAELRTNEDKRYLFVAIDRTSKFAVAQLVDKANRKTVWEFLVDWLGQKSPIWDSHCTQNMRFRWMRTGISFTVSLADRLRLQAIVAAP